jgi:magnesium and cobalt transporter
MEPHSQKKKNLKHPVSETIRNKNSQNSSNSKGQLKEKCTHWSKISEIFAVIFRKNNREALIKSMTRMIDTCEAQELIAAEEKKMIKNIINIGDVKVDDVMIPRTDIIAVRQGASLEEIKKVIIIKEHSRIPVYRENLDEIIGFIHCKDLVKFLGHKSNIKINDIIRKILYVPHSMRIIDLLLKMRSLQVHMAIVLDEYGGTDGLVTIEDIMEEIVGKIEDEHDVPDNNIYTTLKKIDENIYHVGGRIEIEEVEELLGKKIIDDPEEVDFDTVGGLILAALRKVPEAGETFNHPSGYKFKVLDADMRSVRLIEISLDPVQKPDSNNDDSS